MFKAIKAIQNYGFSINKHVNFIESQLKLMYEHEEGTFNLITMSISYIILLCYVTNFIHVC